MFVSDVADEMKDVPQELSDASRTQRPETAQSDQTTILYTRTRSNLHFVLCIKPVITDRIIFTPTLNDTFYLC